MNYIQYNEFEKRQLVRTDPAESQQCRLYQNTSENK